jgi:DNA repair protein RadC
MVLQILLENSMINYYTANAPDINNDMQKVPAFISEAEGVYRVNGLVNEEDICKMATAITARHFIEKPILTTPDLTMDYFRMKLGRYEQEVFCIAFLDKRLSVITCKEMFVGTHNQAEIYPREVVRTALHYNAAAVFLAHNHPSGCLDASENDIQITEVLKRSFDLFDIKILDHIIVGGDKAASMMQKRSCFVT